MIQKIETANTVLDTTGETVRDIRTSGTVAGRGSKLAMSLRAEDDDLRRVYATALFCAAGEAMSEGNGALAADLLSASSAMYDVNGLSDTKGI